MRINVIKTGATLEVSESYARRLIEQGRAVIAKAPKAPSGSLPVEAEKKVQAQAPAAKTEKPKGRKKGE